MQSNERNDADHLFRRYLERPRRRRLARLVDACYRFVWDTAFRVTGNSSDAADITQDVFLKLLLHPPRPDQVSSPHGFLAWEVVGRAANLRRAAERRTAREQVAASRAGEDGLAAADLDELRVRLKELPDDLRTAVELRYFAGLKNCDIATLTGVGERHVEKRLERARELLRSRIGPAAPLIVLLDRDPADAVPSGSSLEPPASLRAELARIASCGAALAIPSAKAAAAVGGITLAKKGVTAVVIVAILLLGGATTAVLHSTRRDSDSRARSSGPPSEPAAAQAMADATKAAVNEVSRTNDRVPNQPYGSVRGTVWDEEGVHVAGARVTLEGNITEEDATRLRADGFPDAEAGPILRELVTGKTGEYFFGELYPVKHRIDVEMSPYLPNWIGSTRIKAGEEAKVDLILCLPLRLHGTVLTPEGDAVKGAQIFIGFDYSKHFYADPGEPAPDPEHAFPADDEGQFDTGFGIVNIRHFCSLPGYVLAPGREMKDFQVSCHDFRDRVARLDLVLAPERRLTVLVEELSGAPVAGATVQASNLAIHKVVTDVAGRAALDRLPAERFSVSISKEGFESESVDAATLDSSEVHVLLKPPGAGIEGQITFDDALPREAREVREVYFYELGAGDKPVRFREVHFDDEKNMFSSHPKGTLRFEAVCETGWRVLTQKPLVYDGQNKLRVEFQVRLEPPYIAGRVLRAGAREPLPGVPILLHLPWRDEEAADSWGNNEFLNSIPFPRLPGNKAATSSGADGSFLFLLSSTDRYRSGTPMLKRAILTAGSDEAGYSADLAFDVDIDAQTVLKDVELEVNAFGAIEGQVVDETGELLPGALVAAYDGYHVLKHGKADATAHYRIEGLRPGQYLLEFLGHAPYAKMGGGGGAGDAEGLPRPCEFFERPVRVDSGVTSRWNIDLRTDALGAIDGFVPPELAGATGAECGLMVGDRPRVASALGRHDEVREGRFQLESLLPGTYRVWLSGKGGALAEMDVAVKRGPRTSLVMPVSTGSLGIQLEGASAPQIAAAKIARLVRVEAYQRQGIPVLTEIAASKVSLAGGRLQLEGLVSGNLRATVLVPGCQAVQTEPIWVAQGRETIAPALMLAPGRTVRVRLELPDGLKLPGEPEFTVIDLRTGDEVPVAIARQGNDRLWELSGFPDGLFKLKVYAGSPFLEADADVTISGASEQEVAVRLELQKD